MVEDVDILMSSIFAIAVFIVGFLLHAQPAPKVMGVVDRPDWPTKVFPVEPRPLHPVLDKTPQKEASRLVWDDLADCESGEWIDRGADFITGSADWHSDEGVFEGGLQFHPDTWDWLRPDNFPDNAIDATREQEIHVARLVLERQGWKAWPVCSKKVGLR